MKTLKYKTSRMKNDFMFMEYCGMSVFRTLNILSIAFVSDIWWCYISKKSIVSDVLVTEEKFSE